MHITMLTKEYPPNVYGGAGVHVSHLVGEFACLENRAHQVRVLCFGDQKERTKNLEVMGVTTHTEPAADPQGQRLVDVLGCVASMAGVPGETDVIHAHTWYTHLAGSLLRQVLDAPLILTTHSLEPHRPWKEEQLGRGYRASCWIERTAFHEADGVIAVSRAMKDDVRRIYAVPDERMTVIPNAVDHRRFRPVQDPGVLTRYGIDPEMPYVLLVSRITRQKGISHFLRMAGLLRTPVQVVLCAGAADTEALQQETVARVEGLRNGFPGRVVWVEESLPPQDLPALYSHAAVFVCPSVYEPFGIINLEAMACGTPVVASAVGGIPEVVADGETGVLVPFEPSGPWNSDPGDPERFARDLASAVDDLLQNPSNRAAMSEQARVRVEEHFSWPVVAAETLAFYRRVMERFAAHKRTQASSRA